MRWQVSKVYAIGLHWGHSSLIDGKSFRWYGIATPWSFIGVLRLECE